MHIIMTGTFPNTDVVELLLDNGALVNHSGRTGNNALTPLHDSCWNMHEDVVRILLDKGADPMVKNGNVSWCGG